MLTLLANLVSILGAAFLIMMGALFYVLNQPCNAPEGMLCF